MFVVMVVDQDGLVHTLLLLLLLVPFLFFSFVPFFDIFSMLSFLRQGMYHSTLQTAILIQKALSLPFNCCRFYYYVFSCFAQW